MDQRNFKFTVGGYVSAPSGEVAAQRIASVFNSLSDIAQQVRMIPELSGSQDPSNVVIVLEVDTSDPASIPAIVAL